MTERIRYRKRNEILHQYSRQSEGQKDEIAACPMIVYVILLSSKSVIKKHVPLPL